MIRIKLKHKSTTMLFGMEILRRLQCVAKMNLWQPIRRLSWGVRALELRPFSLSYASYLIKVEAGVGVISEPVCMHIHMERIRGQ